MKRVIILIVTIVILTLLGIVIGILLKKWINFKKAVAYAFSNEIQCPGNAVCPMTIDGYSRPDDLDDQKNMANYCSDLVIRIETQGENTNVPKMTKGPMLYYLPNQSPIGGIWMDDKSTMWISLKGTTTVEEWTQDLQYHQVSLENGVMIHEGFDTICNSILDTVKNSITKHNPSNIVITGHSLGAAIATVLGYHLNNPSINLQVYTFASPRVGNKKFCEAVSLFKLFRYVNTCDIIPTLPPSVSPNFTNTNQPYIYTDCGTMIPFTKNWNSLLNNHMMGIYTVGIKNLS